MTLAADCPECGALREVLTDKLVRCGICILQLEIALGRMENERDAADDEAVRVRLERDLLQRRLDELIAVEGPRV